MCWVLETVAYQKSAPIRGEAFTKTGSEGKGVIEPTCHCKNLYRTAATTLAVHDVNCRWILWLRERVKNAFN